uniref:AmmeMemoRadiSam system protein B n=1 Tax=Eiseniibacteriota bacterium TaxID=2212470 RepID=A0A832MKV9_UNCEI
MPDDPKPGRPGGGRIILPGADTAPEGGSRIILPPGVARETPEDLPERPRLRPLVLMPFRDGEREFLLVNDPLGVMPQQAVLGMETLPMLQLLDGSVTVADLAAAVMRESKDLRVANAVKDFVAQLDRLLMLESPRFEAAYRELRAQYHRLEIRPAALEGHSYPAEREALVAFLDGHAAAAERMRAEAGEPVAPRDAAPRALLAPHLDPRRAGATIARAYLELGPDAPGPLRVVVFGTGHGLVEGPVALTRKHFETPLGKVPCDTAFVDRVAARLGEEAWRGELAHRDEHSIEFQALYLRHRLGGRPFTMVPILCGGFHALVEAGRTPAEDPTMGALVEAVREAEAALGGTTVYVAGVDLSHVGPRFGDGAVDEAVRDEVRARDQAALGAAEHGDAAAWFESIAQHDDSTRICGFAPTWAMLRCADPGRGRVLRYELSEEDDTTVVSIAAMVWP